MTVTMAKKNEEIQRMPLVELAFQLLQTKKEPMYFREIMSEIQVMRKLSDDEVMEVIARLYTEINIDGRFICIGQNVWGLKRWYPVDKASEKPTSRRFVRSTGDAFSDDDEELDDYDEASDDDASDFDAPDKKHMDDAADDDDEHEDDVESDDSDGEETFAEDEEDAEEEIEFEDDEEESSDDEEEPEAEDEEDRY